MADSANGKTSTIVLTITTIVFAAFGGVMTYAYCMLHKKQKELHPEDFPAK